MVLAASKPTELLIGALIGSVGTILAQFVTGISSRLWKSWDQRKTNKKQLGRFRRLLENTDSFTDASFTLLSLKDFLLSNEDILVCCI
jgi:hypothetical protein